MPGMRINVVGNIQPALIERLSDVLSAAKIQQHNQRIQDPNAPPYVIEVQISSWGGDVGTAFAIYNLLRASQFPIETYNLGEVSSAANIVFLAGDRRFACERSFFRFHLTTWDFGSTGPSINSRIEDAHTTLSHTEKMMQDLYRARTQMSAAEVKSHFKKTVCFTPTQAQQKGIIHAVRDPTI